MAAAVSVQFAPRLSKFAYSPSWPNLRDLIRLPLVGPVSGVLINAIGAHSDPSVFAEAEAERRAEEERLLSFRLVPFLSETEES